MKSLKSMKDMKGRRRTGVWIPNLHALHALHGEKFWPADRLTALGAGYAALKRESAKKKHGT